MKKENEVRYCAVCGKEISRKRWHTEYSNTTCSRRCSAKLAWSVSHPFEERLWGQIKKGGPDDCWEWQGRTNNGYGRLAKDGKYVYAHRAAYELVKGPIPDGFEACHSCDNTLCCNPNHIFPGTHTDNMRDMIVKHRDHHPSMKGRAVVPHKLSHETASQIRSLHATGNYTQAKLGEMFGVKGSTINAVLQNKTWVR